MAIVQAGRPFTSETIKMTAGELAQKIRDYVQDAIEFQVQLKTWPDADLVAMGLSQEQVNAIKGFYIGDLPAIEQALKDSTWIKQLLGVGP